MVVRARAKPEQRRSAVLLPAAMLVTLAVAAYWNSFEVPFVFDDLVTIQANAGVQFGDNLRPSIWTTRPLLYITFALNHSIHGLAVWGYHLVNFALHLLNGFLVFLIAVYIFGRVGSTARHARTYATLAAAFSLLHPVQTESVTYISSRSELLSTVFYCLAVLTFIKRDESKIGFGWSLVVIVPFLLGLLTKETVISLPVVLAAYDFVFLSQGSFRGILKRWRFYITFIAGGLGAAYFLVTEVLTGAIGATVSHIGPWPYFLTQLRVIATYIRLLVLPVGLNLDYDFRPSASPLEFQVLASVTALLGLAALAWYLRKRRPVVSFSIFWLFITLAPTSSVVPIRDLIFEHRLYLPLVGISLSFPVVIGYMASSLAPALRTSTTPACVVLLLALCIGTILRNHVWQDEITLWSDVIEKSPHKARPYSNLGTIYFNRREFSSALEVAQRGLENVESPADRFAFQRMIGQIYLGMHRYEDAVAAFRETAKVEDKHLASTAYNNMGVAYVDMASTRAGADKEELLTRAAEAFRQSADLDPDMFLAFDSYVNVLCDSGKKDELRRELQSRLEENDYRAYYGLGKIEFLAGEYAQAVQYFEQAGRLNSLQKMIFFNEAYALNQLRRRDEAIQNYLRVIRLDPLFVQARHNLGLLYMQTRDFANAIASFDNVLKLDPNYVSARLNLAKVYIQLGNNNVARDHLSKVLSIAPQNPEAAALLRQLGS